MNTKKQTSGNEKDVTQDEIINDMDALEALSIEELRDKRGGSGGYPPYCIGAADVQRDRAR